MIIRLSILIGIIFIIGIRANAYSISTHIMLTERAVKEYEICREFIKVPALPGNAEETLSRANIYEDIAFWIKALNWHFYNPLKDLGTGTFGFGHGSLQSRFQELEKNAESSHNLKSLGGLLHFVQDVTNPAHVAPVFHLMGDSFDNYNFKQALPDMISKLECLELITYAKPKQSYFELLDSTTQKTIKRLEETFQLTSNGKSRSTTWKEAFWNSGFGARSKQKGFGQYGQFDNTFGLTKIESASVDPIVYSEFAKQQIRSALNASIIVIVIYQSSSSN